MPPRDVRTYLSDILASIAEIEAAVDGVDLAAYEQIRAIRSRIEREFMIIGEALRQMLDAEPRLEDRITAAPAIIGFCNHLVHGYFLIANATVWDIIHGHLPALKREVESLAAEYG